MRMVMLTFCFSLAESQALIEPAVELRSSTTTVPVQPSFQMPAPAPVATLSASQPPVSLTGSPNENVMAGNQSHMPRDVIEPMDRFEAPQFAQVHKSTSPLAERHHFTPQDQKRMPLSPLQHPKLGRASGRDNVSKYGET